jgi:hypothetical protein
MLTVLKPTLKDLRAEAQRLGITTDSAGCSLHELVSTAREHDDPFGFLAIHAPGDAIAAEPAPKIVDAHDRDEQAEPVAAPPEPLPGPAGVRSVSVAVPLSEATLEGCYVSTHVEVRMSRAQGELVRRLHLALQAQQARVASGGLVRTPPDAIRWLLERLGDNHAA